MSTTMIKQIESFVKNIRDANNNEPQNCDQINITQLEQASQNVIDSIKNMTVNIDLYNNQFDL